MALKLHANMPEGSGSTTANAAKPAHVGTLRGTTLPQWRSGAYSPTGGNWLDFDGVEGGSVIEFPEDAFTTITGEISLAARVKTPQTFPGAPTTDAQKEIISRGGGRLLFGWEEANVNPWIVWLRCYFRAADSDSFELEWRDDNPQPGYRDDEWHTVIVRFRPSSAAGVTDGWAELWVDGVLKDGEAHSIDELGVSGVEDLWSIGGRVNTTTKDIDRNLVGDIQDVRIYDHYLEDWEIADMTVKTKAQLQAEIASLFADNVTGNISAEDLRTSLDNIVDSLAIESIPERTANGAQLRSIGLEEEMTALSGASEDSILEVPIGAELLGVGVRVTTLITGATSFDVHYLSQEPKTPSRLRGCRALMTDPLVVAADAHEIIPYPAEDWDTDDFHDNSTNNSRLTIPAGSNISKVRLIVGVAGSGMGAGRVDIYKNGAVVSGAPALELRDTLRDGRWALSSSPVEVVPGDYFEVEVWNRETSSKSIVEDETSFFALEVVEEVEETLIAAVAVAADSVGSAVVKSVPLAAAAKVRLVANGSNFTAGAVRLALFYRTIVAPAS